MSLQLLRDERARIATQMRDIAAKADYDRATDGPAYDKAVNDLNNLDDRIKAQIASDEILAESAVTNANADLAEKKGRDTNNRSLTLFAKWMRNGESALNAAEWQEVRNTMSTTTGTEGGFTIASEMASKIIEALKAFGGMRAVADVMTTDGGGPLNYPTTDGTTEEGEQVAENVAAGTGDVSFGTVGIPVYKYGSKIFTVPIELLQDSAFDIEGLINRRAVQRIGRITNRLFTTGTGVNQPNGVQVAATVGVTAANATLQVTAILYDSLVNIQHSIDPAYREMGGMRWMFNDNTLRDLRKIKDGQSRPIFVPGYELTTPGGAPDRLLGAPITINQAMPDMGASALSILYGDFKAYVIRDVMAFQMFRFTDSVYASRGQVGFLAWMRSGGNLVDTGAIRSFRNAAS